MPQPEPPRVMWVSKAEQNLNNYLRLLWLQNIYWLKMAIQSMIFDLPDTEVINARLMQNARDFQMALQPFYGNDNAAAFAELMADHMTIASEMVNAMMNSNTNAAERRWYDNAEEMASFLSGINPNWSEENWNRMFKNHMDMMKQEVSDMMARDFDNSSTTFADMERQAMEMADMMTQGIVKQFPQYFR